MPGRPTNIEYRFIPEEFRILREIKDSEGNIIDSRNASAVETIEVDSMLIDEIIDFGELEFPQLFSGIKQMSVDNLRQIETQLGRMKESISAYIEYRDIQEGQQITTGALEGRLSINGTSIEGEDVIIQKEGESSDNAIFITTDDKGKYRSMVESGVYKVQVPNYQKEETVEVISERSYFVDFDLEE